MTMNPPFVSLWKGPSISDTVEYTHPHGFVCSCTWQAIGLYGLDREGQVWALCQVVASPTHKWLRLDDLMSGAAGRQFQAAKRETAE